MSGRVQQKPKSDGGSQEEKNKQKESVTVQSFMTEQAERQAKQHWIDAANTRNVELLKDLISEKDKPAASGSANDKSGQNKTTQTKEKEPAEGEQIISNYSQYHAGRMLKMLQIRNDIETSIRDCNKLVRPPPKAKQGQKPAKSEMTKKEMEDARKKELEKLENGISECEQFTKELHIEHDGAKVAKFYPPNRGMPSPRAQKKLGGQGQGQVWSQHGVTVRRLEAWTVKQRREAENQNEEERVARIAEQITDVLDKARDERQDKEFEVHENWSREAKKEVARLEAKEKHMKATLEQMLEDSANILNEMYHVLSEAKREQKKLKDLIEPKIKQPLPLNRQTFGEVRNYVKPPRVLHQIVQAMLLFLGYDLYTTKDWGDCKSILNPNTTRRMQGISARLEMFKVDKFQTDDKYQQIAAAAAKLVKDLDFARDVRKSSPAAATLYIWVMDKLNQIFGDDLENCNGVTAATVREQIMLFYEKDQRYQEQMLSKIQVASSAKFGL